MRSVEEQIEEEYDFIEKIGTGSFGHIISLKSKNNHSIYACKIEKNHGKKIILVQKQFNILLELNSLPHFPRVYSFKKLNENSYIVMQKLDKNLEELFVQRKKQFTLQTVALIAHQMISSLKDLHESGYLHRDLKPENIMVKLSDHELKLIDFGLADELNVRRATTLIGNVRFSSRNSHFGFSSKKEDLESLVFVLFYFASGSLPWQNCSKQDIELELNRRADHSNHSSTPILKSKEDFLQKAEFPRSKNEIKKSFYEQFMKIAEYIFRLPQKEEPDYRWLIHRCDRLLLLAGTRENRCFDWCRPECRFRNEEQPWSMFTSR